MIHVYSNDANQDDLIEERTVVPPIELDRKSTDYVNEIIYESLNDAGLYPEGYMWNINLILGTDKPNLWAEDE
tara:strand:+ start:2225 stop:2443 length:219 start_codon:yes stop_codon:yes gene_type:complete